MKSPAEVWAATSGKMLRWKMAEAAAQKAWIDTLVVAPRMTFWLGADGDKEAA